MIALITIAISLLSDVCGLVILLFRPRGALMAENLFQRRQLALYREGSVTPHRIDAAARIRLTLLPRPFDWRAALVVVRPETLVRWHRAGFRLLWRVRSRVGRPPIPFELRQLIRRLAAENLPWGEERIANELLLKPGLRVSPRTVRKYMSRHPPRLPRGDQRWSTFLRNHAQAIVACDFFLIVTATFRQLYVFVMIEHESRRLVHMNVTPHPSAVWTLQQLREAIVFGDGYRYLLHDRDSIFAWHLDESISRLGLTVLKSPPRTPTANAICERVIGTIQRECLDWLIPLSASHLRSILKSWTEHYNRGRPHMSLGPGVPDPPADLAPIPHENSRHHADRCLVVHAKTVLGELHHEYSLVPLALVQHNRRRTRTRISGVTVRPLWIASHCILR
ncbi:integrase core domain-containing protein [Paraburkholderia hospita]|uniref:integrase core domain-containing protein n=1 Tax=Paraburkholderia hospita TaxID=169430 RepID=UPI0013749CAB|nr:integrase core domain-containing protein [Paraburkholderia hospita]